MKVVLPGGAGLVGQNLIVHLKTLGGVDIIVLDKHRVNTKILAELHPELTVECVDLAEPGAWQDHFRGSDAVVMLQAQVGGLDRKEFVANNITATKRVLDAVRRHDVPYIVHISSSVVNSVANDDYSATKREQELLVRDSGIAQVILRPTLMFGWFDRKHLGWLCRFMHKMPVFPIPGDGRFLRQPLFVGDFCKLIVRCLQKPTSGQTYDISGLEKIHYIDIIRKIKRVSSAKALILPIPFSVFRILLSLWAVVDRDPPFTVGQLDALAADDVFEVIDWPGIFNIQPTPLEIALHQTFNDPQYSHVVLEF